MASNIRQIDPWAMLEEQRAGLDGYAAEIKRLQTEIQLKVDEIERLNSPAVLLTVEQIRGAVDPLYSKGQATKIRLARAIEAASLAANGKAVA